MATVHYFIGTKISDQEFLEHFFWTHEEFHQALLSYPESKLEGQEVVEFIDSYCVERRKALQRAPENPSEYIYDNLDDHIQQCLEKVFRKEELDVTPGLWIETVIDRGKPDEYVIGLPLTEVYNQPFEDFLLHLTDVRRQVVEKLTPIFPNEEREIRVYSHLNLLHPCNSKGK